MAKNVKLRGFKGFDKNWKCTPSGSDGLQYEVGKTFTTEKAELCKEGMHFCEYPLGCFGYYSPSASRYAEIEAINPTSETQEDTKRVTSKMKIKAELKIADLVTAAIEYVKEKSEPANTEHATGDRSAASATGDRSAASATGDQSAASATGDQSAASATGEHGVAIACGRYGKASGKSTNWIVLTERNVEWKIVGMKCVPVDGLVIKEDVFYTLINGEIVEAE